jgi:hypothetical protein
MQTEAAHRAAAQGAGRTGFYADRISRPKLGGGGTLELLTLGEESRRGAEGLREGCGQLTIVMARGRDKDVKLKRK